MTRKADDPRHRALAELVHQIRPAWNRAGVLGAIHAASGRRTLEQLVHAAVDAAFDAEAKTPAVIQHRDGDTWAPAAPPTPQPAESGRICIRCGNVHVAQLDEHCPLPLAPEAVRAHAQAARDALREAG